MAKSWNLNISTQFTKMVSPQLAENKEIAPPPTRASIPHRSPFDENPAKPQTLHFSIYAHTKRPNELDSVIGSLTPAQENLFLLKLHTTKTFSEQANRIYRKLVIGSTRAKRSEKACLLASPWQRPCLFQFFICADTEFAPVLFRGMNGGWGGLMRWDVCCWTFGLFFRFRAWEGSETLRKQITAFHRDFLGLFRQLLGNDGVSSEIMGCYGRKQKGR